MQVTAIPSLNTQNGLRASLPPVLRPDIEQLGEDYDKLQDS